MNNIKYTVFLNVGLCNQMFQIMAIYLLDIKCNYKQNYNQRINLKNYYNKVINLIRNREGKNIKNVKFLIFSDNIEECINDKMFSWLESIYYVIEQDELKALSMMANCYSGGI